MSDEPASPVCYAATADDAYMGFAPCEEVLAALNELLEAERAGARVAVHSRKAATDAAMLALINTVRDDEARWCAMLQQQILRLDGEPSQICGAFYGKAMAIDDAVARLAFLNRGQSWVVRKLVALLPRIRDDALHQALREMLLSHEFNISQTTAMIHTAPQQTA